MAGGQMLDLEAERRSELSAHEVRQLQAMKTGALLACAIEMGAIIGEASLDRRQALAAYGAAVGATFQIADDILDVEGSGAAIGKATGKDAARGKATLVRALGLDAARRERDAQAAAAIAALAAFGEEADGLRQAARFAAERRL
jgi:farnesyl diphosphate synthase